MKGKQGRGGVGEWRACQGWGKTDGGADPGGSGRATAANKSDVIGQVGPGFGALIGFSGDLLLRTKQAERESNSLDLLHLTPLLQYINSEPVQPGLMQTYGS